MIILCGGDEAQCQYVQPSLDINDLNNITTGVITTNLQPSNYTFAHVAGPNLYLVQKSGEVLVAKCALDICPLGCVNGFCTEPLTPVAQTPFSDCGQCAGDTPSCIVERGVCVGNRVTPILMCIETLESGKKRSHFSYQNIRDVNVTIASNSANNFIAPSGTPVADFTPGRTYFYPFDAFTVSPDRLGAH